MSSASRSSWGEENGNCYERLPDIPTQITEWPSDSFTVFNVHNPSVTLEKVSVWKNKQDKASPTTPKMYKISERNVQMDSNNIWADPNKSTKNAKGWKCCGFCRRNGEKPDIYSNHSLRDERGLVVCPILQGYVCPVCKATGEQAHTVTYCPITRINNMGQTPISPTIMLKTSKFKSNGQQRY